MSENNESAARRIVRHLLLALASCALMLAFVQFLPSPQLMFQISMGTAYGSLFLFALAMLIGPWNVLRHHANPLSSYLRRDIGIWAGILAIAHVVAGLQVHMGGKFWLYFVPAPEEHATLPIRLNPFGLSNYAGLAATLILILLLCLSNNASMRSLGGKRWKYLQRWIYVAAPLIFAHGWLYQLIEKREPGFVAVVTVVLLVVLGMQVAGYRRVKFGTKP